MKIAMDLTQIPVDKTGIGIYALNLVREIVRHDLETAGLFCYFFVQDDDDEWRQLINGKQGCRLIGINSRKFRKLIRRFFFEQVLLPRKCKKLGIDAIYSFHYTMPYLTRIRRVVTVPDMTFYLFPRMHEKIKRIYFKTFIPLSLKKSCNIVTISESTRDDMLKQFKKLDGRKVAVVHLGVTQALPVPENRAKECLEGFGLEAGKYLLYLGTLEPRKNITAIVEAFHNVVTKEPSAAVSYKLVIAGGKGWFYESVFETVKCYGLEERVVFTGYVEEEVKEVLLQSAYLFVYPSFYEGFGLPVLEAMAHGVPVITSNVSSLPEVAGDAALLIDPYNRDEIAEAMLKLLSERPLYDELSQKARKRADRFSWQHTAQQILSLLSSTIGNPGTPEPRNLETSKP
jgi:glycosyltransferase involved in cell wall biosynthesis